jgi:hypothetical protein
MMVAVDSYSQENLAAQRLKTEMQHNPKERQKIAG